VSSRQSNSDGGTSAVLVSVGIAGCSSDDFLILGAIERHSERLSVRGFRINEHLGVIERINQVADVVVIEEAGTTLVRAINARSISVTGSAANGAGSAQLFEELGFALLGLIADFASKAGIALLSEVLDVARELVNEGGGDLERHKRNDLRNASD